VNIWYSCNLKWLGSRNGSLKNLLELLDETVKLGCKPVETHIAQNHKVRELIVWCRHPIISKSPFTENYCFIIDQHEIEMTKI